MKKNAETEIRLELKYCESCGALQLRPMGSGLLYCATCEARVAGEKMPLLPPSVRRRRPRLPSGVVRDLHACVDAAAFPASFREVRA